MNARSGALIVLVFAAVWLWVGASGLPMPWAAVTGAGGVLMLAAVGWHVLRRPVQLGNTGRFDRKRFYVTVALEIAGAMLVGLWLQHHGLLGYQWPALGIVVALHFIGLWWASGDPRYLTLMAMMLAVNVVALFFPPGGAAMLGIAGLGSAASLLFALARR